MISTLKTHTHMYCLVLHRALDDDSDGGLMSVQFPFVCSFCRVRRALVTLSDADSDSENANAMRTVQKVTRLVKRHTAVLASLCRVARRHLRTQSSANENGEWRRMAQCAESARMARTVRGVKRCDARLHDSVSRAHRRLQECVAHLCRVESLVRMGAPLDACVAVMAYSLRSLQCAFDDCRSVVTAVDDLRSLSAPHCDAVTMDASITQSMSLSFCDVTIYLSIVCVF